MNRLKKIVNEVVPTSEARNWMYSLLKEIINQWPLEGVHILNDYFLKDEDVADHMNPGAIHVNQIYRNRNTKNYYTIKGTWDGRRPDVSAAWLMRSDGTGHAYAWHVTAVKNVWDISEEEFEDMCGGRSVWFTLVEEAGDE